MKMFCFIFRQQFKLITNKPIKSNLVKREFSHYISTPIFYVNSAPHIGHLYTVLVADALNRYHKLKLNTTKTILSTGTDEHGLKIQNAAIKSNKDTREFCDQHSEKFKQLFETYDVQTTNFVRTSSPEHLKAVQSVWAHLKDRGYIYQNTYSGWYCESDECFVPKSQTVEKIVDGIKIVCDREGKELVWSSEDNYLFKLSEFSDQITSWLADDEPIMPYKFNAQALAIINDHPISDLSISRPRSRLSWGIEVPNDPTQTIYVWMDALTNYLTSVGYPCEHEKLTKWPPDIQIIGKDILKFHAIYWPGFLLALGLQLPKKILCHSHWLTQLSKISKSRGNSIDPNVESQFLSIDGLRYFLLRCGIPYSDSDYNRDEAIFRLNNELANTYGNLLSRSCSKAINPEQMIPTQLVDGAHPDIMKLLERLQEAKSKCEMHLEEANFYFCINELMDIMKFNQTLYHDFKPWELIKKFNSEPKAHREYMNIQAITFETLRVCSILLQPIIPRMASMVLNQLGVERRSWKCAGDTLTLGHTASEHRKLRSDSKIMLFPRLKNS